MTDPFQNMLLSGNMPISHFPVTSRYYKVETAVLEAPGGKTVVYLRRRFIPSTDNLSVVAYHQVKEGDRLDNIAASYVGDPEQFWQIADANNAIRPGEITEDIGREIKITQPQGLQAL